MQRDHMVKSANIINHRQKKSLGTQKKKKRERELKNSFTLIEPTHKTVDKSLQQTKEIKSLNTFRMKYLLDLDDLQGRLTSENSRKK